MITPHFESPKQNADSAYAIWNPEPLSFTKWIEAFQKLYHQMDEASGKSSVRSYIDVFDEDIQQYLLHLLRMAPFSRAQVSLYNIACGAVCTTKEIKQLVETSEWSDGQLPESFVALRTDSVQLGLPPAEAMEAMKEYGTLLRLLAEDFVVNDSRRLITILEAQNIISLLQVVANPFADQFHLEAWKQEDSKQ